MKTAAFDFFKGVLTVLSLYGLLWGFGFVLEYSLQGASEVADDPRVRETLASPDGEYLASSYIRMGGGAAGWCYVSVDVRKKTEEFNPKAEAAVFSSDCRAEIKLTWEANRALLISYSTDGESASLTQKTWSKDNAVRISYSYSASHKAIASP